MNSNIVPFLLAQAPAPVEATATAAQPAAPDAAPMGAPALVEASTPVEAIATAAQPAAPGAAPMGTPAPVEATAAVAQPVAPIGAPAPFSGGLKDFLPLILIFAILYFIMIRPAQRKEKERKKEISELRAGTKVLFAGGLIGTIVEVKDATFRVEVADGVVLEIARGAVQRSLQANESPAEPDAR